MGGRYHGHVEGLASEVERLRVMIALTLEDGVDSPDLEHALRDVKLTLGGLLIVLTGGLAHDSPSA